MDPLPEMAGSNPPLSSPQYLILRVTSTAYYDVFNRQKEGWQGWTRVLYDKKKQKIRVIAGERLDAHQQRRILENLATATRRSSNSRTHRPMANINTNNTATKAKETQTRTTGMETSTTTSNTKS